MTMAFFHSGIELNGSTGELDIARIDSASSAGPARDAFHLIRSKMEVPKKPDLIHRPRIHELLSRSVEQFPATLISGRAGTGKTALAAEFAERRDNVSWYSMESSDQDWPIFCRYFAEFISIEIPAGLRSEIRNYDTENFGETEVARYLLNSFASSYATDRSTSRLLVMDDIHHVFDTDWFEDFFKLLLYALPSGTHLLMLCRSKPPGPLWRLRSKQMLNVLDEKVIAFNESEAERLFLSKGLSRSAAGHAYRCSYGRISKLLRYAEVINADLGLCQS